ncbi:ATP-dependent DNA ligase [Cyanobium sp. Cruz CV13-4-11]|jgi:DNA ligase 1|uniref:ATP-dependent DNA ligase n=1 Tax=unclassified Cyanobium TaxID=2627006 RepID=UPI0020CCDA9D|nr:MULTISPECIES: ATP-dependent DNA ligase [unclassified Cyanobium]MCP9900380.1 ATP-dependent DNA ligase [Cyanobium sp. Cruz CV11-17]MCP9919463.1 ATP-dependent DNA ligase [Cyanobium sp. Cruz CV13-4-11]
MQAFADLIQQLERAAGTRGRVAALADHLGAVEPADAAWALALLLGKRRRRLITGRRLRQICLERSGLPEWLFDSCHAQVGDSAETIALLLPQLALPPATPLELPLAEWMDSRLPALAALEGEAQAQAVLTIWAALPDGQCFLFNKLLTGGFRVGVAAGLVIRALAQVSGLEEAELAHRLMGGFEPSPEAMEALLAPLAAGVAAPISRPYPFCLASPLETERLEATDPAGWQVEWKWDGIRAQLIRRNGQTFLWSRGEELINASFPDLDGMAEGLPQGTVLDGELTVWPAEASQPAGFGPLQRRLGRQKPGAALLRECPAAFVAYDLLERGGQDLRPAPLFQRRAALEDLLRGLPEAVPTPAAGLLRLSPVLPLGSWEELETLRQQARFVGAEGLMLKALDSSYGVGRRRGLWWKHKLEPMELDAVLLYAQAGSGRRANLYTDYTFGLWDGEGRLVTFAKAYSGLDDSEITELDRWIRRHTTERFGPVRAVEPLQVFTLGFEGLQRSSRHRSGLAVRFPRILRWRRDRTPESADSLSSAQALLEDPAAAPRLASQ